MSHELSEFRGYPWITYESIREMQVIKNNCPEGYISLTPVTFSKTYVSYISFEHSYYLSTLDTGFEAEAQAYANAKAKCTQKNNVCAYEYGTPTSYSIKAINSNGFYLDGMELPYSLAELTSASPLPDRRLVDPAIFFASNTEASHNDPDTYYTSFFKQLDTGIGRLETYVATTTQCDPDLTLYATLPSSDMDGFRNSVEDLIVGENVFYANSMQRATKETGEINRTTNKVVIAGVVLWLGAGLADVAWKKIFNIIRGYDNYGIMSIFGRHPSNGIFTKTKWSSYFAYSGPIMIGGMVVYSLVQHSKAKTSSGSHGRVDITFFNKESEKVYNLPQINAPASGYRAPRTKSVYHPESGAIYLGMYTNRTYRTGFLDVYSVHVGRHGYAKYKYNPATDSAPYLDGNVFWSPNSSDLGNNSHIVWINTPFVLGYIVAYYNHAGRTWKVKNIIGSISLLGITEEIGDILAGTTVVRGNTVRDHSDPNICYMGSSVGIVSYNSTTETWSVIRH